MNYDISICPNCGMGVQINLQSSIQFSESETADTYLCPICNKPYFAINFQYSGYSNNPSFTTSVYPSPTYKKAVFSENITTISSRFVTIYNQAVQADFEGLNEISGSGYRKALEVLIKDFASYLTPEKSDEIKHDSKLSNVINNRISNNAHFEDIKEFANRSWWLGNDESHYYKLYEPDELKELKTCVDMVINEIEYYLKKKELKSKITKK